MEGKLHPISIFDISIQGGLRKDPLVGYTVKKINLIQIGYLEFRTNLRFFRVLILDFRTISQYLNSKTEFGPGLEQFQQIRTILRFLDPIQSYYSNLQKYYSNFQNYFSAADFYLLSIFKMLQIVLEIRKLVLFSKLNVLDFRKLFLNTFYKLYLIRRNVLNTNNFILNSRYPI